MAVSVRRRRGRPLEADRSPAIQAAALELLGSRGYDHIRMQDVAERAGVGLATIYRRWPTKQRLVCDALRFHGHDLLPERTGDARADLEALFRALAAELSGPTGDFIPGFLAAIRSDPEVAEVFHEVVAAAISHVARDLVADVLGPDEPTLDVRADLGPSLLMFRALFLGVPVDPDEVGPIVQLVLAPGGPPAAKPGVAVCE